MGKIKVTRKLLDSYRKLKREIPLLEAELEEMQKGDNGFDHSVILDYRTGFPMPQTVVGFDWGLYERRKKILASKKAKVKAVEEWINEIEDGQTRVVFRMYYIDGMTWERIAAKTCYNSDESYPRKMIRDKYLDSKKIK